MGDVLVVLGQHLGRMADAPHLILQAAQLAGSQLVYGALVVHTTGEWTFKKTKHNS